MTDSPILVVSALKYLIVVNVEKRKWLSLAYKLTLVGSVSQSGLSWRGEARGDCMCEELAYTEAWATVGGDGEVNDCDALRSLWQEGAQERKGKATGAPPADGVCQSICGSICGLSSPPLLPCLLARKISVPLPN